MNEQAATLAGPVETPTGKGAGDENFPVASFLIAPALRGHVARFYDFARAADDIADNPDLTSDEKIRRLDLFEAALDTPAMGERGLDKPSRLAESLSDTGVSCRHARDLLAAFRQDARKTHYDDWDDLLGYCTLSANPVGRYLMDLHGEDRALWAPSDALCTVLQILNHLQDCQSDFRKMDRVYLPGDWLSAEGLEPEALDAPASNPGLRRVLDRCLDGCDAMIVAASNRPVKPRSRRLHAEMAVITQLARRLARRLRRDDPLAMRVKLSKWDFAMATFSGLRALLTPRRG